MSVMNNPADFLLSGISIQTAGAPLDTRAMQAFGYLVYYATGSGGGGGGSAIFNLEGSHDTTGWMIDSTYTATATQTGTAQVNKFYPYIRANLTKLYSGAGGTGQLWVHYSPGLGGW